MRTYLCIARLFMGLIGLGLCEKKLIPFRNLYLGLANVSCPSGESECPDGNTCCLVANNRYGCCPEKDAVCCQDKKHCCPKAHTCTRKMGLVATES